ncbi:TonB-dependent receptor [Sphingomonas sp.]|uniref:TonB-dependent receptor domain-containing protein n=1 Tax=Sphingomonas sp. TaxID=28214 RepID=UPI001B1F8E79|nr:TonB-dependent receptor [Sphingomonas sp.]MBO9712615.1 TonB-dependent receptor [Sphingomonas sp.]
MALALCAAPACAQRTDDNATREAEDAFGSSVGNESIGIYNPFDVRGFSPVDAGNVRIEGLYFDQQTDLSQRVIAGSTIRVGISAQGYAFPAPTGIVDFALRRAGKDPLASFAASVGPWGSLSFEADAELPIDGERLGFAGGAGVYRNGQPFGAKGFLLSYGGTLRWAPRDGVSVQAFWGQSRDRDEEAQPLIATDGMRLPPKMKRGRFLGQHWADNDATGTGYGVIAHADPLGLDVSLGAFRSVYASPHAAADLLFGVSPDGSAADRVVVLEDGYRSGSTSGELRVSKSLEEGPRRHTLVASLRGRAQDRRYGGAALVDLGPSSAIEPDFRPAPSYSNGPKTRDAVRQATLGVAYQGQWKGVGELGLGIQKSRYTKRITDPDPSVHFPETRDSPLLIEASAAAHLTHWLALYAGYTRGLEESPVAPREAANLNEAPPAIHTRQKDAGARIRIGRRVTAVVGVFDVEKPYFNLDSAMRFRQLGMVRNRGVEMSVAGEVMKGLTLVAGNVLIDAKVSGEEVRSGAIGPRPVASFRRHSILSLDYAVPGLKGLSIEAAGESISRPVANSANTLSIPARSVVNLGARYRFSVGETKLLVHATVANVFGVFGWNNTASGFYIPNGNRRYSLTVAADI